MINRVDDILAMEGHADIIHNKIKREILTDLFGEGNYPLELCYACAYNDAIDDTTCDNCPLVWGTLSCGVDNGTHKLITEAIKNKDKQSFIEYCNDMINKKVRKGVHYK